MSPARMRITSRGVAYGCVTLFFAAIVAAIALGVANHNIGGDHPGDLTLLVAFAAFELVGGLIVSRRPENSVGWVFTGVGLLLATGFFAQQYAEYALMTHPGSVPLGTLAAWYAGWYWFPLLGLSFPFTFYLFPTGRLVSPRWRPLFAGAWVSVVMLSVLASLNPVLVLQDTNFKVPNPIGVTAVGDVEKSAIGSVFFVIFLISLIGGLVSLIVRFRRADREGRQQIKWFVYAAGLFVAYIFVSEVIFGYTNLGTIGDFVFGFCVGFLPVSAGIAILKYRLYDIDVVINKTVVFGALAAFITAVYVAIVAGVGALVGSEGKPNLALSIVATAIVAVAFQPVRDRVQRFANRLVYGQRATPYEVLSEFSERVAETYATEDVLPRMAQTIAEGTGAARAQVWLRADSQLRPAASYPHHDGADAIPLTDGGIPDIPGADKAIEVLHQGELLGALSVTKPPGEPLTPAEEKLLQDLGSQAGLVLKNVGLTSELLARLDELQASRQRLVTAQDEERRRLERDLHDGAQQHLVALKTRLSLARRMAAQDAAKARALLEALEAEADETLATLRDLARGIYPPLLADQGLRAALEAQAAKAPFRVTVSTQDLRRYSQDIEAAIYFCCLEALQNIAKYAHASRGSVSLAESHGELNFMVQDDGRGFDPVSISKGSGIQNMVDRIEALGGSLAIIPVPGRGTTVTGHLRLRDEVPVP